MLLLFKGASATLTATIAGIGAVVASGSTVSATCAGVGTLNAPNSIELMVSVNCAGVGGVLAIPQGFLTRTALVDGQGNVVSFGGFGSIITVAGIGGVTATVGSFFDGGVLTINGVGTAIGTGRPVPPATLIAGLGNLTAIPIISGGTISSAAQINGLGGISASFPVLAASVIANGQGDVQGTGGLAIPILATQMRLSFAADEIRLFFRKG